MEIRPGNGLPMDSKVFLSHDQMVAHGQPLESPPIGRELPGQPIVAADDAVPGHGRDDGQPHTDMGALMWGWGS